MYIGTKKWNCSNNTRRLHNQKSFFVDYILTLKFKESNLIMEVIKTESTETTISSCYGIWFIYTINGSLIVFTNCPAELRTYIGTWQYLRVCSLLVAFDYKTTASLVRVAVTTKRTQKHMMSKEKRVIRLRLFPNYFYYLRLNWIYELISVWSWN